MARAKKKDAKLIDGNSDAGHNSERSEEQLQALFLQQCEKRRAADAKVAEAKDSLKGVKEQAVHILGKELAAQVGAAIKLVASKTAAQIKAERDAEDRLLRWVGLPLGEQGDLFAKDAEARAFDDGKRAGMIAAERQPPNWFVGSTMQFWFNGYDKGQEVARSNLQDAMTPPDAAPGEEPRDDLEDMGDELPMGDE